VEIALKEKRPQLKHWSIYVYSHSQFLLNQHCCLELSHFYLLCWPIFAKI